MILKAIDKMYKKKEERNWEKLFLFYDIHETILYPDYSNKEPLRFYPHAKETLQLLSKIDELDLGLYTCSHPHEIENYQKFFKEHDIHFIHVNKNLEVPNTRYGHYEDKPYFNLLVDDKSGFDAETDWLPKLNYFKEKYKK